MFNQCCACNYDCVINLVSPPLSLSVHLVFNYALQYTLTYLMENESFTHSEYLCFSAGFLVSLLVQKKNQNVVTVKHK